MNENKGLLNRIKNRLQRVGRKVWGGCGCLTLATIFFACGLIYAATGKTNNLTAPKLTVGDNTATNANAPTPTAVQANNLTWVLADTEYRNPDTEWVGPYTCEGPSICEWYRRGSPPNFGNEGFVALLEGESVTFPAGYVGHVWGIPGGNEAVVTLTSSYRHLLFYSNIMTEQELRDEFRELYSQLFWQAPVVKPHVYMHVWLRTTIYGVCNFADQSGCAQLDLRVRVVPDDATWND